MCCVVVVYVFFFFKQKTAYEMRISDWSSDVCSSDLAALRGSPRFLFCTPDGSVAFFAETFVRQLNDAGPRQSVPAERLVIHVVLSGDGDDALNISTAPPEHADGLETLQIGRAHV